MKRLAAIILSALILFSFAACDLSSGIDESETSSSIDSIQDESESTESDMNNGIIDENYEFISQDEKNSWRSALISVLSKSRVHEFEPNCPGSISVGLMDINFDNSPEVLIAYAGGSMNNIYIEIYDLKSDDDPITYDAACYGNPYNIRLYVADKGGKFVLLSEGSLRIPETGWVNYICIENIDRESNTLSAEILFKSSGDSNYYEYRGQAVEKAEFEALYQQFLLDYKKIESTQIQMIRWSDIGEVEKREPEAKSSAPIYTREEIAEKMADALINSSQKFIRYENVLCHFSDYESILDIYRFSIDHYAIVNHNQLALIDELKIKKEIEKQMFIELDTAGYLMYPGRGADDFPSPHYKLSCGYDEKDLNGDGINELVLLNDDYKIVAIFSTHKGMPIMLGSFQPRTSCWIGGDGLMHICGSNGAAYSSNTVCKIADGGGELIDIIEFGIDGGEIVDGAEVLNYYKTEGGDKVSITKEEFDSISTQYGKYLGAYAGPSATKDHSGLEFTPLFENPETDEDSDKYSSVPTEYRPLLIAYEKMATYKKENGSTSGLSSHHFPKLANEHFNTLLDFTDNYNSYGMGYFLYDINRDGTDELVFSFWGGGIVAPSIYIVFTSNGSDVTLIGSYSDRNNHDIKLGDDGKIHLWIMGKGEGYTQNIFSFDQNGITEVVAYCFNDFTGVDGSDPEWLKLENGEWVNITEEEFLNLEKTYAFNEIKNGFEFQYFFEFAPK